jgi:hypothetical protein
MRKGREQWFAWNARKIAAPLVAGFLFLFFFTGHVTTVSGQSSQNPQTQTSPATYSQSYPASGDTGELQPTYPGEPLNKPPVKATVGSAKLRVYGTVYV